MEKIYKRKLIPSEALFIRSPGAIVGMVAKISGDLNSDKFKYAVKKLIEFHPILNCKIIWDKNREPYFIETNNCIPISIYTRNSPRDFENIIIDEWKKGFDLLNGPLCRFTLVRSDLKSEIIFAGHHTIVDGMSITLIIDLLLKIMDNSNIELQANYSEELPSIENLKKFLPKQSFLQRTLDKSISNFINYRWKKSKTELPQEDIIKAHRVYFEHIYYLVAIDELTKEETSSFIDKCKEHNVTVNSALAAAFLTCRSEIDGDHITKKTIIPVDLRKRLGASAKKSIGCYSISIDIMFTYETTKSFWENAKTFNALSSKSLMDLQDIKRVESISGVSLDFLEASMLSQRIQTHEEIFKVFPYAKNLSQRGNNVAKIAAKNVIKDPSSFTITNLGLVTIPSEYEMFKLENLIMYPSSVSYPRANILLSVITINNKLTLSYHMLNDKSDSIDYNYLVQSLKERLRRFICSV